MRNCWQLWEGVLPKEKCEELIFKCDQYPKQDATIFSSIDYKPDKSMRDTQVAFINDPEIYKLIHYYFQEANRNAFAVDMQYIPHTQYGVYTEGSFYDWHYDVNWIADKPFDRKLSIVIQLSDSNDYEGGEFEFQRIEQPKGFRTPGSVLVFPSYLTHRVTTVTKGTRRSLVNWAEGPRWR